MLSNPLNNRSLSFHLESEPAIVTHELTKRYGQRLVVDHLNLVVHQGEAFALVGPDGAGKTTTIRLLTGIMSPDGGQARVLGFDTVAEAHRLRKHIGYLPQRFGLYDDLTVAENLAFYRDIYQVPKAVYAQRAAELLDFADLTAFRSRLASQLSGGMRQKLGLICVLIHTPKILFLDEPTFGVDPVSRREFWQILYRLLKGGLTIFLSTAYMDEAERAHRVGLLNQGRLLIAEAPQAIKAAFQGELLEVRTPELLSAKKLLSQHPLVRQVLALGDRLLLTVERAVTARRPLGDYLQQAGMAEFHLAPAEPSLEDLFVQLVRQTQPRDSQALESSRP